ncbi:F0F1 ATP synthase subunit B [Leptolyngbya cf. ectocarpi LEGE 11479]|uniref:ATP synthase subunit b n=1 Tax=Leptolyngbya cf. ectocarpi LEGE 11479 TaxID=1828722 RepID=A0A928ZWQ7_LEPEC|nr:F0F1 ATP synthase subunit B [Leptolyngbya ectocarpi]MBE9068838.1 F0F1 ATP synthase subunit B [Leptolyngbya cf. ectocarpi LEGE 11479]
MVENFWLLATEEGGFGLNFNIFETNLINLSILVALIVYFGRSFLGSVMAERRSAIEVAIQDAEKRQKEASEALAVQKKNLTEAQATAVQIKSDGEAAAKVAKENILAQASKDVQRMKDEAARDLTSQRERVVVELRQQISTLAIEKAETQLRSQMDDGLQQKLIDQSIGLIGR